MLKPLDRRVLIMGKTVTLHLRQDHEQGPTTAAKLSVIFIHYPFLFQLSHFFRSKHRSRWQKTSWFNGLFSIVPPSLGTSLSFNGTSLLKYLQIDLLLHYVWECPETLSQAQEFLQLSSLPPRFKWKLTFPSGATYSAALWSRTCPLSSCSQPPT